MKKEDVIGLIIYLIIIALAIVFGLTVLQTHNPDSAFSGFGYVAFVAVCVIAGVILNSIMFELAHVLGAKIGTFLNSMPCLAFISIA